MDETDQAVIILWDNHINYLQENKSYQLNRLEIRIYMGKKQLAFASCPSIDEINSIEGIIDCQISSDEEDELLTNVSISGVRELEIIHQCINCTNP